MQCAVAAVTDVGLVRRRNEDRAVVAQRVLIEPHRQHAATVAVPFVVGVLDGMGGHPAGDIAAQTAAEVLAAAPPPVDEESCRHLVMSMQDAVYGYMRKDPSTVAMGTTVVFASVVAPDRTLVTGVGDSSAMWLADGHLAPVVAEDRTRGGLIVQCIGGASAPDQISPHIAEVSGAGRLLLCSDGLADLVGAADMQRSLQQAATPEGAADELVELALAAGGRDNVTVVVVDLPAPAA